MVEPISRPAVTLDPNIHDAISGETKGPMMLPAAGLSAAALVSPPACCEKSGPVLVVVGTHIAAIVPCANVLVSKPNFSGHDHA